MAGMPTSADSPPRRLASEGSVFSGLRSSTEHSSGAAAENTATSRPPPPPSQPQNGLFRIFAEDLRPTNVLIDKDDNVVGVIDWEFAYAALAEYSRSPPWWLLLRKPGDWPEEIDKQLEEYSRRLQTFLRAMRREEGKLAVSAATVSMGEASIKGVASERTPNISPTDQKPLSRYMLESWNNKHWLVRCALRDSWRSDFFYWRYLDAIYFGENEEGDYRKRLAMLTEKERQAMDFIVTRKMEENKQSKLGDYEQQEVDALLKKVLV